VRPLHQGSYLQWSAEDLPGRRARTYCLNQGKGGRCSAPADHTDAVEPAIIGCESVLIRFLPAQKGELMDAVIGCAADRMREEHHAEGFALKLRITARLVERVNAPEPETVQGCDRTVVELEHPKAQPPALEGKVCEPAMKGRPASEGRVLTEPRFVQPEEVIQVRIHRRRLAQPVSNAIAASQPPFTCAHLVTEVGRPPREKRLETVAQPKDRVAFPTDKLSSQLLGPVLLSREVLADEDVPVPGCHLEQAAQGAGRVLVAFWSADGTQRVSGTVAEEAHHAQRSAAPEIQRKDGEELSVRVSAADSEEPPTCAEVLPPGRRKLPCRKDVLSLLREVHPFFAQRFQAIDKLEPDNHGPLAHDSRSRDRRPLHAYTRSFRRASRAVRSDWKSADFVASSASEWPGGRGDNLAFRNQLFTRLTPSARWQKRV
jgi:hypothetical protein